MAKMMANQANHDPDFVFSNMTNENSEYISSCLDHQIYLVSTVFLCGITINIVFLYIDFIKSDTHVFLNRIFRDLYCINEYLR